jgi:hypothetical protein
MLSGRADCAKLAGINAAAAMNTALYSNAELLLGTALIRFTGDLLLPEPHRQVFAL